MTDPHDGFDPERANPPPRTASEFLALPEEPNFMEVGVCYFAPDDAIIHCFDADDVMWKLGRDANGRWYRRRR